MGTQGASVPGTHLPPESQGDHLKSLRQFFKMISGYKWFYNLSLWQISQRSKCDLICGQRTKASISMVKGKKLTVLKKLKGATKTPHL